MNCLILKRQPPTFNAWKKATVIKKDTYKAQLAEALETYNPSYNLLTDELYGKVYHFFNEDLKIDADNLSKPLWDSLKNILFNDDYQVKLRHAGSFNLQKNDITILNLSGLSGEVIIDLLDAFETEDHVLYVECGRLHYSMFTFNSERP
ncbi:MAG: RusA family crossover junction endodeoxyribonuclease [Bacteroidota bacterium]